MKFDTLTSTLEEKKGLWDNMHARRKAGKPKRKPGDKNYPKTLNVEETCGKGEYFCNDDQKCKPIPEGTKVKSNGELVSEGEAWTRKEGQNKEGGLNEKGRKSYERANPGSDLKAPSKKKGNKRRASFCARMKGMRKRQKPSNNTGEDRLSKSLRAWNCSYEWELDLLEDAKMGKQSDDKLAAAHKKFSGMDQSSPANKFMLKRISKEMDRRKKVNEHHQKDEDGKVIEHEDTPDMEVINPKQPWDKLEEAKVDMKTPDYKRATVRDKRYGNPHGSHELGGGIRKDRRADHEARRGVKKEEVISERQKDSDGQRLSLERGRSNYGKASVRNMRASGTGGNAADPAERLVAMDARHKAHKEKRGVKKEETVQEGAWQRKEGKSKTGGLNEKGRKSYERENPGSDLKAPQPKGGPRKRSFCARMGGVKGPMMKDGKPTRKKLALDKWKCNEEVKMTKKAYNKLHKDFKSDDPKNPRTTKYVPGKGTVSMPVKFVEEGSMATANKNVGASKCWTGYKRMGTQKKDGKTVPKCVKAGNISLGDFLREGNPTSRMLSKSKSQVTGNISADRGTDEKKNKASRKGLEKDLKKKGIGYKKGVGEYKYKSDDGKEGTGREVSYQTSPGKGMSKRRFGKLTRRLGRKHGQESVITKDKNKPARLHDTQSKKPGKSINIGKSKPGKSKTGDGETSGTKVRSGKLQKKTNKPSYHYG